MTVDQKKKKKKTPPSVDRQLVDLSNAEAAIDARKQLPNIEIWDLHEFDG